MLSGWLRGFEITILLSALVIYTVWSNMRLADILTYSQYMDRAICGSRMQSSEGQLAFYWMYSQHSSDTKSISSESRRKKKQNKKKFLVGSLARALRSKLPKGIWSLCEQKQGCLRLSNFVTVQENTTHHCQSYYTYEQCRLISPGFVFLFYFFLTFMSWKTGPIFTFRSQTEARMERKSGS